MPLHLDAVVFEVADANASATFWAGLLDRTVHAEPDGALVPGTEMQVGLRLVTSDTVQVGPRQLHLHLTSSSLEHRQQAVHRALDLGGKHLDVGQSPDDRSIVLADPDVHELGLRTA